MKKIFKFYTDPGHGWLAVKVADVLRLGMSAKDFSSYSYTRGSTLYLEEDGDASKFQKAWESMFGKMEYVEKHTDGSHPIRSYNRNSFW